MAIMRHLYLFLFVLLSTFCSALGRKESIDGIDVSHHQGKINWTKVHDQYPKLMFVYVKATEGKTYTDPRCEENVKNARSVGYKVGVYHFFRMTSGAREQFANFNKMIAKVGIDLVPMVDVETSDKHSTKELKDSLIVFINLIKEMHGVEPMIYGTNRSYNTYCAPDFNHLPMYIGRYGTERPVVKGPSHYSIWQYSENGIINGIPKPVDLCRLHKDFKIESIYF